MTSRNVSLSSITATILRDAGLTVEADRLEQAARTHAIWTQRPANENTLALSVFGSAGYDRLLEVINAEEAA